MNPLRVLVADPHWCVREGLKAMVNAQPDMRVVGEACDGPAALVMTGDLNPDVVVMEASLPGLGCAQVVARMREACPDRKVLVLTACEHKGTMRLLRDTGARGYVLKRSPAEQLTQAIRAVAAGGTYLDPELAGEATEKSDVELSARECYVVRRIALGYSNKEIAAQLKVSVKTVETYKTRAMEKIRICSRVGIVRFAVKSGWLDDLDDVDPPVLVAHSS